MYVEILRKKETTAFKMNKISIYKPRSVVGRYYALLFSLPKWQYLVGFFLLTYIVLISLYREYSYPYVISSIIVFIALRIYTKFNRESVFNNLKRCLGLVLVMLVYSILYTIITKNMVIAIVSSTSLFIIALLGLDGTSVSRYFMVSVTMLTILVSLYLLNYISLGSLYLGIALLFIIIILDIAIYMFMSRRRIDKYSLPDIGTLYLRNWLDKKTEIEKIFEESGIELPVNPRILEFNDVLVMYTDVHYGPFSNIGSSNLPELLIEHFNKLGFKNTITLHGLGGHSRNIVSSRYVREYIDKLTEMYLTTTRTPLLYHGAFTVNRDEWRILGIVFNRITLLFTSRPGIGIDDLPHEIQLEYEIKARDMGIGDIIIIDSHNWELFDEIGKEHLEKLKTTLDIALEKAKKIREREPVEVYSRFACKEAYSPGLIGNRVCILCISGADREEACIVYLRGNNMKPGVRDIILKEASLNGVSYIEVITNDEHSETGTRARAVYIPIHESPELLNAIKEITISIDRSPPGKKAWLYNTRFNLKLMGQIVTELERHIKESIVETFVLLLLYVFVTPIIISLIL